MRIYRILLSPGYLLSFLSSFTLGPFWAVTLYLLFSLRNSPEFQKLLGIAMELFLLCSDDAESDVRMVADECLNKVIKVCSL